MKAGTPVFQELRYLRSVLTMMIEGTSQFQSSDLRLLRLCVALTEYGQRGDLGRWGYPKLGPGIHQTFREFLDQALTVHLNVRLPDALDTITSGDMKTYCRRAWEQFDAGGHPSFVETLLSFIWYQISRPFRSLGIYRTR